MSLEEKENTCVLISELVTIVVYTSRNMYQLGHNALTVLSMVAKGKACLLGWAESVKAVSWESPNMMASENRTTGETRDNITSIHDNKITIWSSRNRHYNHIRCENY